jgi:hypothetical protein
VIRDNTARGLFYRTHSDYIHTQLAAKISKINVILGPPQLMYPGIFKTIGVWEPTIFFMYIGELVDLMLDARS